MKKPVIRLSLLLIVLSLVIYTLRKPIMYCSGIGTKFFYTNTFTKGSKDSILVIYTYGLPYFFNANKYDSLEKSIGLKQETSNGEVSQFVLNLYNRQIMNELRNRLGKQKWEAYLHKRDSLNELTIQSMLPKKKCPNQK